MEQYLTTKELSERIKMAPGSIRNHVSSGVFQRNIHYVKPTSRKILFVWSAVEAWLYGKSTVQNRNQCKENSQSIGLIRI